VQSVFVHVDCSPFVPRWVSGYLGDYGEVVFLRVLAGGDLSCSRRGSRRLAKAVILRPKRAC
jgi:hypothetical protein